MRAVQNLYMLMVQVVVAAALSCPQYAFAQRLSACARP